MSEVWTSASSADELAAALDLKPHPEGGFYREWYRSPASVEPSDGRGRRAAMTSIYFLLPEGQHSRWHVLRSDESWTILCGAPLELLVVIPEKPEVRRHRLNVAGAGGVPSVVVPAGAWQAARPLGGFALVACNVAPGFDFDDFQLVADDRDAAARLRALDPAFAVLL